MQSIEKHPIPSDSCLQGKLNTTCSSPGVGCSDDAGSELDRFCRALGDVILHGGWGGKDDRLKTTPGPAPCQAVLCFNRSEGTQEITQRHSLALNYGLVTL